MDNSYPEYRFYKSRSRFRGTDVFEIYPGDMTIEPRKGNPGAVWIREEGFEPFARTMRAALPKFEWYDFNRLNRHQARRLLKLLDRMADAIAAAQSAEALLRVDDRILVVPANFTIRKAQLMRMTADLGAVVETAVRNLSGLWVLGL